MFGAVPPGQVDSQDHQRTGHLRLRSRSLIRLTVENDEHPGGNPIDHSCNTYDRGRGRDQIGNDARQAGQDRTSHEAEAAQKCYPASSALSSQLVTG